MACALANALPRACFVPRWQIKKAADAASYISNLRFEI
jgi:hypothetical protein